MKKRLLKITAVLITIFTLFLLYSCLRPTKPKYPTTISSHPKDIEKIFIVTGEPSGDCVGAWYLNKIKKENPNILCEAIGNKNLQKAGADLIEDSSKIALGIVGITKLFSHIPTLWNLYKKIAHYILEHDFKHVVLVDAPLINLPLARKLKNNKKEHIRITYLAPPEMWIWGKWGMDRILKKYCDQIIVLYPHEVAWYKKQGLSVDYHGYPFYKNLNKYFTYADQKENLVTIFLGSRKSEIETTLPLFAKVIKRFVDTYPDVSFILPLSENTDKKTLEHIQQTLIEHNVDLNNIYIPKNEEDKHIQMAKSCIAITKPGTMTLVFALLQVPSIIAYKVPWLTYWFAKLTFHVDFVGLPNLILDKNVCDELIQSDCTVDNIFNHAEKLYKSFLNDGTFYQEKLAQLEKLRVILKG